MSDADAASPAALGTDGGDPTSEIATTPRDASPQTARGPHGDRDAPVQTAAEPRGERSGPIETARQPLDGADATTPSAADPNDPRHRRIRSFVTRAGRVSPAQQRARDTLGARYVVPFSAEPLDYAALFGRVAPVVLEIGFGMGAATAVVAGERRELDFIGIEVHSPGVGALLKMVGEADLTNLRIVEHDAVEVIERMTPAASLAGVLVWFPDPWHKARHNKRRLIQPAFVSTLASRLAPGGFLHCATDWEEYAVQMLDVLAAEPVLENTTRDGYATPQNALLTRPVTKFETRGKRLGHGVWDVVFTKRAT